MTDAIQGWPQAAITVWGQPYILEEMGPKGLILSILQILTDLITFINPKGIHPAGLTDRNALIATSAGTFGGDVRP